jgi:hypothetical protein
MRERNFFGPLTTKLSFYIIKKYYFKSCLWKHFPWLDKNVAFCQNQSYYLEQDLQTILKAMEKWLRISHIKNFSLEANCKSNQLFLNDKLVYKGVSKDEFMISSTWVTHSVHQQDSYVDALCTPTRQLQENLLFLSSNGTYSMIMFYTSWVFFQTELLTVWKQNETKPYQAYPRPRVGFRD